MRTISRDSDSMSAKYEEHCRRRMHTATHRRDSKRKNDELFGPLKADSEELTKKNEQSCEIDKTGNQALH